MRKAEALIGLTVLALATIAFCGEKTGADLYISPRGNDDWSGRLSEPNADGTDGPFATLERARDEIRKIKRNGGVPEGGIVAEIRAGRYELAKPLELTAADSGAPGAPVVYRAETGKEVRIAGSRTVAGWKSVTDAAALKRLPPAARGKVLVADLKAQGIVSYGTPGGGFGMAPQPHLEVVFNDEPMPVSRWPNDGFAKISAVLGKTPRDVRGRKGCVEGVFRYEGDRPKRWVGEKDAWLLGYWFWDWAEQRQKIKSIDTETHTIELAKPWHRYGYKKGQWFYVYNILAELDRPGEWMLDRKAGRLYFWPPGDVKTGRVEVTAALGLAALNGVSHVVLRGLIFEGARGTAVTIKNGEDCRIVGCTIRNVGGNAVVVSGGKKHGVVECDMHGMGEGGIRLNGGDRKTLSPAGHFAENNHIHHYSRWDRMYRPGIVLGGVGNRASHNLIDNAPHMAMGFGGNEHIIEFNEIHSVCYESNDCGAIYAGRNWTMRGNLIRFNFLHDISGYRGRASVGIYLDDMFSSASIVGNIFLRVTRAAFIGGGRDNLVENNIFIDCPMALHGDARALGWAHTTADRWIAEAKTKGTISGILYNKPPYSTRYPELADILKQDPKAPRNNVVCRNIFWPGNAKALRRIRHGAKPKETWWNEIAPSARDGFILEGNLINRDPKFVDEADDDFRLRKDSPALKLGFKPIPVEKIGLHNGGNG